MLGCLLFLLPVAVCFIFSCLTRRVMEMSQEGMFVLKQDNILILWIIR